jgi:ubiquitin carboxyl-terminal hydrolase 7
MLICARRILFFPYGNQVDHASFYLEQAWEKEPPENWYACVQFALVLWNVNDPSLYVSHGKQQYTLSAYFPSLC